MKVKPDAGVANKEKFDPMGVVPVQSLPQLIKFGNPGEVTVPLPVFVTLSVRKTWLKLAVTVRFVFKVTVQVPVPGQVAVGEPDMVQPVKVEPPLAAAVKVIWVPSLAV